jgi:hypothetical protein
MTLSGDPQVLIIRSAIAGFSPDPAQDGGTVYSIEVAETSDIVAQLDGAMPPGVTLRISLETPTGATGTGTVSLSTAPQALVRSIPPGTYTALGIVYELSATVAAGVVSLDARQVVFTVTPAT